MSDLDREPLILSQPGLTLRLSNGGLALQEDMIEVAPGASLELYNMVISSDGVRDLGHSDSEDRGVVYINGEGASAYMEHCTITAVAPAAGEDQQPTIKCHAVLVAGGGRATLDSCTLEAATGSGLHVQGTNSRAFAIGCTAQRCAGDGFSAAGGARVTLQRCSALNNSGAGFCAAGSGARLVAGSLCKAEHNAGPGFHVGQQGYLHAEGGAVARLNQGDGYSAHGAGSHLKAGSACIASANGMQHPGSGSSASSRSSHDSGAVRPNDNGYHGFHASGGAHITAGKRCASSSNAGAGFLAEGPGSYLEVCQGSTAAHNGGVGLGVFKQGLIKAGEKVMSVENGSHGFLAEDTGSLLETGACCRSDHNHESGFMASEHAQLQAGDSCSASSNWEYGLVAADGGQLAVGKDSKAANNYIGGFAAVGHKAKLMHKPGCTSWGNICDDEVQDWVEEEGGSLVAIP
jgi:hypothetical protein